MYWRANVLGARNLLDAMRATGIRRLVFSSTAAVYGEPARVPITEDAATRPLNAYGRSKLAVDHMNGDPAKLVASSKKIRDELRWTPRKAALETILADAWAWHQANPDGYAN